MFMDDHYAVKFCSEGKLVYESILNCALTTIVSSLPSSLLLSTFEFTESADFSCADTDVSEVSQPTKVGSAIIPIFNSVKAVLSTIVFESTPNLLLDANSTENSTTLVLQRSIKTGGWSVQVSIAGVSVNVKVAYWFQWKVRSAFLITMLAIIVAQIIDMVLLFSSDLATCFILHPGSAQIIEPSDDLLMLCCNAEQ